MNQIEQLISDIKAFYEFLQWKNQFTVFKELPKISGNIGRGYDILKGNPKTSENDEGLLSNLFEFVFNQKLKINENSIQIPYSVETQRIGLCSPVPTKTFRNDIRKYQNDLKDIIKISIGSNETDRIAFTNSKEYILMQDTILEGNSVCENASQYLLERLE